MRCRNGRGRVFEGSDDGAWWVGGWVGRAALAEMR